MFTISFVLVYGSKNIQVEAEKVIQDKGFIPNESSKNINKELVLTNNSNNFLVNGKVVAEKIGVGVGY